jgi:hypothetical protein
MPTSPLEQLNESQELLTKAFIRNIDTFLSRWITIGSLYDPRAWDAALAHNPQNADLMLNDAYVASLLQERIAPLPALPWSVVADDDSFADDADYVTACVEKLPRWSQFVDYLAHACWYGKYGSQLRWGWTECKGQRSYIPLAHEPVHGDKFLWDWTDEENAGVMISTQSRGLYPADSVYMSQLGPMLKLNRPSWRAEFVIHTHRIIDADYFKPQQGARIHGFGLRSAAYWCWNLRNEVLQWVFNLMSKVGLTGILIIWYEEGNKTAEANAQNAAEQAKHDTVLLLSRPISTNLREAWGVQHIPIDMSGVGELQKMVDDYFQRQMERLIVGQGMSGGQDNDNGLGGSGRAKLAKNTKDNLTRYDCLALGDTLTSDLVGPICRLNRPQALGHLRFHFNLPDDDETRPAKIKDALAIGLKVAEKDAYAAFGLRKPKDGEPTIGGVQQGEGNV